MDFVNQGISPSWSVRWRFLLFLITDSTSKDAEREIQRYKYTHTCHAYGRTHRSTQKAAPLYASIQTPTILAHTWTTQAARTCFLSLVDQDWLHYTHTSSLSHFTCTVTLIGFSNTDMDFLHNNGLRSGVFPNTSVLLLPSSSAQSSHVHALTHRG